MSYKDNNGENATKDFPRPAVETHATKMTTVGYRVNVDGDPIHSDGNVVDSPEEADGFYEGFYGDDLERNKTYHVPASETPDGYVLHSDFSDPAEVDVGESVCNVAFFGYVHDSEIAAGDVTVKHVVDNGI